MIKKDFREQGIKIRIVWILQPNQFDRLEKGTGHINYEKLFYMVLTEEGMTEEGINLTLIIGTLILLLNFIFAKET